MKRPFLNPKQAINSSKKISETRTIILVGVSLLLIIFTQFTNLVFNLTESLPHKAFLVVKHMEIKRGDSLYFKWKNLKVVKQVEGMPGDKIEIAENSFKINGVCKGGFETHTSQGVKLTPIKPQIIPQDHYFVMTRHARSHDSRYQDFGLIQKSQIIGKAFGFGG